MLSTSAKQGFLKSINLEKALCLFMCNKNFNRTKIFLQRDNVEKKSRGFCNNKYHKLM